MYIHQFERMKNHPYKHKCASHRWALLFLIKHHNTVNKGEQGVVLAQVCIVSSVPLRIFSKLDVLSSET